jgi:hypothetical protein
MAAKKKVDIASLPPGVWKIPPNKWLLSLRKADGTRDIRRVTGTFSEARVARDTYMKTGQYTMSWLIEDEGTNGR